jgi:signal peptidase II
MMIIELLLCAGLVIAVDQLSKLIVVRQFEEGQFFSMGSLVQIRRVSNTRESFGLPRNRLAMLLLWGWIVLSMILLVRYGPFFQSQVAQMGLGAALGGATSNLLDRWLRGVIIDFIDVGFWPVFNIADAAIVLGVAIALWFMS